jgi:transcriptional regulator with XRE-family HTH domain
MKVGVRMAELRKKKELSQTDFAKTVGVSREMIGRYERDEVVPSIEVAKKIADALEVSLDYLAGEGRNAAFDKQTMKRMEDIERLPNEEKNIVYRMIDMALVYSKTKKALAG